MFSSGNVVLSQNHTDYEFDLQIKLLIYQIKQVHSSFYVDNSTYLGRIHAAHSNQVVKRALTC